MGQDEDEIYMPEFMKADDEQTDPEAVEEYQLSPEEERMLYGTSGEEGKTDGRSANNVWTDHEEGEKPKEGQPWGGSRVKEEGESWGDHMLTDKAELSFKHETLAHMAASGMTNKKIAQDLGMTEARISVILTNTLVGQRVKEIQARYWGGNIEKRFKQSIPAAMDVMDDAIKNQSGTFKSADQLKASMWLLEKVTGKAKQEVDHTSGSLKDLLQKMDDMTDRGEVIDVSPQLEGKTEEETEAQREDQKFDNWIDQNLGGEK